MQCIGSLFVNVYKGEKVHWEYVQLTGKCLKNRKIFKIDYKKMKASDHCTDGCWMHGWAQGWETARLIFI